MKLNSLLVALFLLAAGCAAGAPDDEHSRDNAQEAVLDLIDVVSRSHHCDISLSSVSCYLGVDVGLDTYLHTASIEMNGEQCAAAIQELRDRGEDFRLAFVEIWSVEMRVEEDSTRNLDLIHEIDPRLENYF